LTLKLKSGSGRFPSVRLVEWSDNEKCAQVRKGLLSKISDIPVPGYQAFWTNARKTFNAEFQRLVGQHPDAEEQLRQLFKVLCDFEDVAWYTPVSVGENHEWTSTVSTVEENHANYCKAISWKTLCSALYGTYAVTLNELKCLLKASIFSEEHETTKTQGHHTRKKASKKFAGVSGITPKRPPKLQRKRHSRPKRLQP
jgi:hypothetical protein